MADTDSVYVLRLTTTSGATFFYVGRAASVPARLAQHRMGNGCSFTGHLVLRGAAVELMETRPMRGNPTLEDAVVKEYMAVHGVDRVRGGSYCKLEHSPGSLRALSREMATVDERCFKCGGQDHFAVGCRAHVLRGRARWTGASPAARAPSASAAKAVVVEAGSFAPPAWPAPAAGS